MTRHALRARGIDRVQTGASVSFPLYDGHGNQVSSLQRSGARYTVGALGFTDPWGVRYGGRTDGTAKYCANLGHPTDYETGLVYMRARYYEPWTGRFISQDPARDGWNWYAYGTNNPVLVADFDGMLSLLCIVIFLAIIAYVALLVYDCKRSPSKNPLPPGSPAPPGVGDAAQALEAGPTGGAAVLNTFERHLAEQDLLHDPLGENPNNLFQDFDHADSRWQHSKVKSGNPLKYWGEQ